MNYRLDIEYDGTRYEGWQRQKRTENTIQGKIEEVLSRMIGEEIEIDGAGRTDAGDQLDLKVYLLISRRGIVNQKVRVEEIY